MAGIKDIAKAAGVSISTVSNVLCGKPNVGKETKNKILQLCNEMDYNPNHNIIIQPKNKTKTILFNFSDFDRSFYLRITNGIHDFATANGYDLLICTQKTCEKFMKNKLSDGCIILDASMQDDVLVRVANSGYPVVTLDRHIDNPYIGSLVVNNYDPMTELVQTLVDKGYSKFGFVGGPEHTNDTKERYMAFRDVLEKNNIEFYSKNYFSGNYREKSGYQAAKIFMLSGSLPEVLICANDNMAIGAIKAFKKYGINTPDNIGITGFDNSDFAELFGLTTVAIPNYERGYLAARYLVDYINTGNFVEPIKITPSIKWRSTIK